MNYYLKYFTLTFLLFFIIFETPSEATDSARSTTDSIHNNCPFSLIRFFTDRNYGKYDLIKAVIDGDVERVRSLAARGANLNVQDGFIASYISSSRIRRSSWTPLMYALHGNNLEMVRLLIELDTDVNFQNLYGLTPLMIASRYSDIEVIDFLITSGAIDVTNNFGTTAFTLTIIEDRLDVARLLIDRNDITIYQSKTTELMLSARHNKLEAVKFLIDELNIDVNARNQDGWTAYMIATFEGHLKVTEFLNSRGAEFSQKDYQMVANAKIIRQSREERILPEYNH